MEGEKGPWTAIRPRARGWNACQRAVKPGPHTITVNAYDNVGTASITVTK
jgi:hypothetical protein